MEENFEVRWWRKFQSEWGRVVYMPLMVALAAGQLDRDLVQDLEVKNRLIEEAVVQGYKAAGAFHQPSSCYKSTKCVDCLLKQRLDKFNERLSTIFKIDVHDTRDLDYYKGLALSSPFDNTNTIIAKSMEMAEFGGELVAYDLFELVELLFAGTISRSSMGREVAGLGREVAGFGVAACTQHITLFAHIGKHLQCVSNDLPWIDSYSSKDFQTLALESSDLLHHLISYESHETRDSIEELYHVALKAEREIFQSRQEVFLRRQPQLRVIVPLVPQLQCGTVVFMSGFFNVCVEKTTVLKALLFCMGPRASKYCQKIIKKDGRICRRLVKKIAPSDNFEYGRILSKMEVEAMLRKNMNTKLETYGVISRIKEQEITLACKYLVLKDGCKDFFRRASSIKDVHLNIVSCCWSTELIRATLSSNRLSNISVHANELEYNSVTSKKGIIFKVSTGILEKKIETSIEKLEAFNTIIDDKGTGCKQNTLTVYVGHSTSDLLCLLKANIGIVLSPDEPLRRLVAHLGVSFVPLFEAVVQKQKAATAIDWKSCSGVLHTACAWGEVEAFMLGN